jgi:hypothetical protein
MMVLVREHGARLIEIGSARVRSSTIQLFSSTPVMASSPENLPGLDSTVVCRPKYTLICADPETGTPVLTLTMVSIATSVLVQKLLLDGRNGSIQLRDLNRMWSLQLQRYIIRLLSDTSSVQKTSVCSRGDSSLLWCIRDDRL